jgi:hypothetical protein
MRFAAVLFAAFGLHAVCSASDPVLKPAPTKVGFPKFDVQEIATDLSIGYAVVAADIDGDGKPDIVVVDKHRVVWYQNPTWKVRTILTGKTRPDNVCVAPLDIDGGGDLELVVGAGWKPFDTATPGTLQWLKRGKTVDDEWTLHPVSCDEPMVHRVAVAEIDGKPTIVMAPLMGRGATAKGNWTDGRPCRIVDYPIPADPVKGPWVPLVLNEDLHVVHNLTFHGGDLFAASYEGVTQLRRGGAAWKPEPTRTRPGDQANPKGNRGSSEVVVAVTGALVATVEPWHGNQVVVYEDSKRTVLDDHLRWGHAIKFLGTSPNPTIVAGVRDDPNPKAGDTFTERRGVRLYKKLDGVKWTRHVLDDGGIAVEDLIVADLNGDGRPDIVAVGRATGNCRIYWNRGE